MNNTIINNELKKLYIALKGYRILKGKNEVLKNRIKDILKDLSNAGVDSDTIQLVFKASFK